MSAMRDFWTNVVLDQSSAGAGGAASVPPGGITPPLVADPEVVDQLKGLFSDTVKQIEENLPPMPPGGITPPLEADPEVVDKVNGFLSDVVTQVENDPSVALNNASIDTADQTAGDNAGDSN